MEKLPDRDITRMLDLRRDLLKKAERGSTLPDETESLAGAIFQMTRAIEVEQRIINRRNEPDSDADFTDVDADLFDASTDRGDD